MSDPIREYGLKFISDDDFNEILDRQASNLQEMIIKVSPKSNNIVPLIIIIEPKGESGGYQVNILMLQAENFDSERYEIFEAVGIRARQEGMQPIAAFMVSEAWLKGFTDKELANRDKQVRDYDDKKEVAIISGRTIDGRCNMASFDLIRGTNQVITSLENLKTLYYDPDRVSVAQSNLLGCFFEGYAREFMKSKSKGFAKSDNN